MPCTRTPGLHNDGCGCPPDNQEHIGAFTLYRRQDRDGRPPYYLISWSGTWLPGMYHDRDAALMTIGIVAGGESVFTIDDICDAANRASDPIRGRISTQTIMDAIAKAPS